MLLKISKLSILLFAICGVINLYSQIDYKTYTIASVFVEGNTTSDAQTIISLSGLKVGDQIKIPGDNKLPIALRNLWARGQFSDIQITIDKITELGVFIKIKVLELPRISEINIKNNKEVKIDEILKAIDKQKGDLISSYDSYLMKKKIKKLYEDEGLSFAKVNIQINQKGPEAVVDIDIEEGVEFYVTKIDFEGNIAYSDDDLASEFSDTHTKEWWQFWRSSKFNLSEYKKDKELLLKFYKKNGFIDADIIKDSIYYDDSKQEVHITVYLNEGNKIYVRNITFEGNTVFPSEILQRRLEFNKGDVYDLERFQQNLIQNQESTDALSVYLDNGYIFASMEPEEKRIGKDSVDINIKVNEGNRVVIRRVNIVGNTKTKDKVIRRELYTRPGDYFSRAAIIRSIRALGVLSYFNPEALRPDIKIVDKTRVDVQYKVEERSTDTFNASVGIAGSFGLTGSIGFSFNNFSILEPLKGGAGQIFNFNWEFGQLNQMQNISFGFTEPWLFDEPTTLGFNIWDSKMNYYYNIHRTGAGVNVGRRFRWPDDYFRGDWSLRVQRNDVEANISNPYWRPGITTEVTISQTISRISLNSLFFPTSGSRFSLTSQFAMGAIGLGNTDYLKNILKFEINQPLIQIKGNDRLVLHLSTNMGYIASFVEDSTISPIELFYMGGNGLSNIGVIPLRGYSDRAIGPSGGGNVMAKHVAELRFAVSLDPMPVYLYAFAEAGNVWSNLKVTDPFNLKKAAGIGVQILMNPIGIIGFSYGYGFDSDDITGERSGWKFLFYLGQ